MILVLSWRDCRLTGCHLYVRIALRCKSRGAQEATVVRNVSCPWCLQSENNLIKSICHTDYKLMTKCVKKHFKIAPALWSLSLMNSTAREGALASSGISTLIKKRTLLTAQEQSYTNKLPGWQLQLWHSTTLQITTKSFKIADRQANMTLPC